MRYFSVLVFSFLLIGCIVGVDEEDADQVDTASIWEIDEYRGLYLYGYLRIPGWKMGNGETGSYDESLYNGYWGKLRFADLDMAIASKCIREFVETNDGKIGKRQCFGDYSVFINNTCNPSDPNGSCESKICSQALHLCKGYKYLELYDAVGATAFESRRIEYSATYQQPSQIVLAKLNWRIENTLIGNYSFNNYDCENPIDGEDEIACELHYIIPPQKPENKTLLLMAALEAFRQAGVASVRALNEPSCRTDVLDTTAATSLPTLAEVFATHFSEIQERYLETINKLVVHQRSVASSELSNTVNRKEGSLRMWSDGANSNSAILSQVVGSFGTPLTECPEIETEAVKKARRFLEAGTPAILFDDSSDIASVGKAGLMNIRADSGDSTQLTTEDLHSYMDKMGFDIHSLTVARSAIKSDFTANYRVPVIQEENPNRVYNLAKSQFVNPPSFFLTQSQGLKSDKLTFTHNGNEVAFSDYYVAPEGVLPHRSSIDFLGYMRDAALIPVTDASSIAILTNTEVGQDIHRLYGLVARNLVIQAGDKRVTVVVHRQTSGDATSYHAEVRVEGKFTQGATGGVESEIVLLWDSIGTHAEEYSGYRCALQGSIDGAPCSVEEFDVNGVFTSTLNETQDSSGNALPATHPFSRYLSYEKTFDEAQVTNPVWVFEKERTGKLHLLIGFTIESILGESDTEGVKRFMVGGEHHNIVTLVTERSPDDCNIPNRHCTGLPSDLVPPLENETNNNGDAYENSWKFYLSAAKEAAVLADQLGERLVEHGLSMDMRAEQAARELAKKCGGSTNVGLTFGDEGVTCSSGDSSCSVVDEYASSDPSLQACMPTEDDYIQNVSMGGPLCTWRIVDAEECECPENMLCPACPLFTTEEDAGHETTPCAGIADHAVSAELYPEFVAQQIFWKGYPNHLNLFEAPAEPPQTTTNCQIVRDLRERYENGETLSQTDFEKITTQGWFDNEVFKNVALKYRLQSEPFFNYTLLKNGMVVASTMPNATYDGTNIECPTRFFWRPYDGVSNSRIDCGISLDEANNHSVSALVESDFTTPAENPAVAQRIEWGYRLGRVFKTISALTGSLNGFTVPKYFVRGDTHQEAGDSRGYKSAHYPYTIVHGNSSDGNGRRCLVSEFTIPQIDSSDYNIADDLKALIRDTTNSHRAGAKAKWRLLSSMNTCGTPNDKIRWDEYIPYTEVNLRDSTRRLAEKMWLPQDGYISIQEMLSDPSKWLYASIYETHYALMETDLPHYRMGTYTFSRKDEDGDKHDTSIGIYVDSQSLWDTMEFVCQDYEYHHGGCASVAGMSNMVQSKEDLLRMKTHLQCVAYETNRVSRSLVFDRLPKSVVDSILSGEGVGNYPNTSGEYYNHLREVEMALRSIKSGIETASSITFETGELMQATYHNLEGIELSGEINHIQGMQQLTQYQAAAVVGFLSGIGDAAGAVVNGNPIGVITSLLAMGVSMASASYCAYLEQKKMNLQHKLTDSQVSQAIHAFLEGYSSKVSQLRQQEESINASIGTLKASLKALESLKSQVSSLAAMSTMADSDTVNNVFPVNTVMRRRYNTDRIRYENQLQEAKRLAYVARKAIEFRFGVDLSNIYEDMSLVEAPANWVDRLCLYTGFDYSQIRDATQLVEANWFEEGDNYAHAYIGDYVAKLEAFTRSYSFDYPFQDSKDLAVISLREDIAKPVGECEVDSYNELLFSSQLGKVKYEDVEDSQSAASGWLQVQDCGDASGVTTDEGNCLLVSPYSVDSTSIPSIDSTLLRATRIADNLYSWRLSEDATYFDPSTQYPRSPGTTNNGYLVQTLYDLAPGDYILSFYAKDLKYAEGGSHSTLNLTLRNSGTPIPSEGDIENGNVQVSWGATTGFQRFEYRFYQPIMGNVDLEIRPSADASEYVFPAVPDIAIGDVAIGNMQLERVEPGRCPELSSCPALPYQDVDASKRIIVSGCKAEDPVLFRKHFERKCICNAPSGYCSTTGPSPYRRCFYEINFSLSLDDLERGALGASTALNVYNYNYRHNLVGVNLVGTNVRQCGANSPSSCYTNAYVKFNLTHSGKVRVRNFDGDTLTYSMDVGQIVDAKAVAAEALVTNPMSSSHNSLFAEKFKAEFHGRPLQGQYTLKIWDDNGLKWQNVEDIQLIFKYGYWTQFQ